MSESLAVSDVTQTEGEPLTEAAAEAWLPRTCFKHGPPQQVGVELEFVVHERCRPHRPEPRHLDPARLGALHADLAGVVLHGAFTAEPGGQVELSSPPAHDLRAALAVTETDLAVFTRIAERHDARLVGVGVDPLPHPPRVLTDRRYDAMEAYFDGWGPAGRTMMRSTASVQVNLEAGRHGRGPDDLRRRWELLHLIGPPLVAAFSTSTGHPTSDRSWAHAANQRQGVWQALDPARCAPARPGRHETVPQAWARWVLDAPLMLVRRPEGPWTAPAGVTFRSWLRAGDDVVPGRPGPDLDDLAYHLTTLFPPVRARGHLEVRYLDAQPGRWWRVPVAVVTALADDDGAGDAARSLCRPVADRWADAARLGLRDDGLAAAADGLLGLTTCALRDATPELAELVEAYRTRWTARRLTPATAPDLEDGTPC